MRPIETAALDALSSLVDDIKAGRRQVERLELVDSKGLGISIEATETSSVVIADEERIPAGSCLTCGARDNYVSAGAGDLLCLSCNNVRAR